MMFLLFCVFHDLHDPYDPYRVIGGFRRPFFFVAADFKREERSRRPSKLKTKSTAAGEDHTKLEHLTKSHLAVLCIFEGGFPHTKRCAGIGDARIKGRKKELFDERKREIEEEERSEMGNRMMTRKQTGNCRKSGSTFTLLGITCEIQ